MSKTWYRSLRELENTAEFQEMLHREFPEAASEFPKGLSRRRWLQIMGSSLALAGVSGCRFEAETLAPFATRPANRIPGKTQQFNTTVEIAGQARALRATSYDGRPIKLDGNPDHLSSGGASDSYTQATILDLYDPDRGQTPIESTGGSKFNRSWIEADTFLTEQFSQFAGSKGDGLCVLAESTSSPTAQRLKTALQDKFPQMKWFDYSSLSPVNSRGGATLAFGKPVRTEYDLESAAVVVTIDSDLLGQHPEGLRNARSFSRGRNPDSEQMTRLYAVECEFTGTAVAADHRVALRPSQIAGFLASVEQALASDEETHAADESAPWSQQVFAALVDDLKKHPGQSVITVGERQPVEVHALAHRLNQQLGNIGKTITLLPDESSADTFDEFVTHAEANGGSMLLLLGGNPVYDSPADVEVADLMEKFENRVHFAVYPNETSAVCNWYLPMSHPLECWSDATLYDGTYGVAQPLIEPLFESRSQIEFLAGLLGEETDGLELVRQTARELYPELKSTREWERVVHNGFHADSTAKPITPELQNFEGPAASTEWQNPVEVTNGELEVVFTTDSSVLDGRFANNAWLQELPHPLTKMTWSNAAIMSPKTADALGVKDDDVVRLELDGRQIELPVYVQPGQATGSVAVAIGYGRTHAGLVGGDVEEGVAPVGVNAGVIRTAGNRYFATGLKVSPTGRREELAVTQDHYAIDKVGLEEIHGRVGDLVREGTLDEYREHPEFAEHRVHHPPLESLWTEVSYDGHAWGMAIDLNKCIGCNACVVACQSENNVPVVGPDQVRASREMHWMKVDRYFTGDTEEPEVATQPVTCQHCENAPCEQVCPVAATVHSNEGLNDMAYNRCIGTRYCGNNCPYKVRRFNFLDYRDEMEAANRELMNLVLNPEVTVRSRGVMEKCTYCVQRIQNTRIEAKNERRPIGPNEIQTACQQVCASEAIVFGDLNNPESDVAKAHADARAYGLLAELNVKPRTKYLARIRNPHPWLAPPVESAHGHGGDGHGEEAHGEHAHADERHDAEVSHNSVPAPTQELREEQV